MTTQPIGSGGSLLTDYDALLLDLDGTLHRGSDPVPAAAASLRTARDAGLRLAFVTNNASRTPGQVVDHLAAVGIQARTAEVLTSAQAGARVVRDLVPAGSAVLVVGGAGLTEAVIDEGLLPVEDMSGDPKAVIQGWFPGIDWPLLAEGAYALATGIPWVATNADLTLPTAAGVAPGNGSFVKLLTEVTGRSPDVVAGKPGPMMLLAAAGTDGRRALVVGDRLDTDIAGAVAAGLDSLLVLTGVTEAAALFLAAPAERPTYVASDLAALAEPQSPVEPEGDGRWVCGSSAIELRSGRLVALSAGRTEDLVRALAVASWTCADDGRASSVDLAAFARVAREGEVTSVVRRGSAPGRF